MLGNAISLLLQQPNTTASQCHRNANSIKQCNMRTVESTSINKNNLRGSNSIHNCIYILSHRVAIPCVSPTICSNDDRNLKSLGTDHDRVQPKCRVNVSQYNFLELICQNQEIIIYNLCCGGLAYLLTFPTTKLFSASRKSISNYRISLIFGENITAFMKMFALLRIKTINQIKKLLSFLESYT